MYLLFYVHSDNENPLIRGLALRSLCSLRLESILEYIEQPLKKSLSDISAYVRKTAVIGILKVTRIKCTSKIFFSLFVALVEQSESHSGGVQRIHCTAV